MKKSEHNKKYYEVNKDKWKQYNFTYINKLKADGTYEEHNKKSAQQFRAAHPTTYKEYQNLYQAEYRAANPAAAKAHKFYTFVQMKIKNYFDITIKTQPDLVWEPVWKLLENYPFIKDNLRIKFTITPKWFYKFDLSLPRHIILDVFNVGVASASEPRGKRNLVTDEQISIALRLEAKYTELYGFTNFLKTFREDAL